MQQESFLEKNFKLLYWCGVVISFLFMLRYADHQLVHGDQWQMLERGYATAYTGEWINHGNEASGFFNVVGSFLTAAVALPLMVFDSPWSPMVMVLLLRVGAFFLLDAVVKDIFKPSVRLGLVVLFLFNPWIQFESILYNPSYLAFCAALHLFSAYKMKDAPSIFYMVLHVLSVGIALQCHNSWILLPILSCYLWYRNLIKISWSGVFLGGAIVIASLIPYIMEFMHSEALQTPQHRHNVGYGFTHIFPILKSILYWLRYGSFLFTNKIVARSHFEYLGDIVWIKTVAHYLWMVALFAIGTVTVIFSAKINWALWTRIKTKIKRSHENVTKDEWFALYCVGGFIALVIASGLSPIIFNYWHLSLLVICSLFPLIFFISDYSQKKPQKFAKYLAMVVAYFFVVNLNTSVNSFKFSHDADYKQQVEQGIKARNIQKEQSK